ncbi:MAG: RidA family protein [Bacteroidota bacterium]
MLLKKPAFPKGVKVQTGQMIFLSGQVALDQNGKLIGNDFSSQFNAAITNVSVALSEMNSGLEHIVHLRIYVVSLKPEHRFIIGGALEKVFEGCSPPANTLIGIQSLARKDLRVEIEAIASSKC